MMTGRWRKSLAVLLSIALVYTGVWTAAGDSEVAHADALSDNLFVNGDFEQTGEDGLPIGWQTVPFTGVPTVMVDETVYHSGSRSYKLSADTVSRFAVKQEVMLAAEQEGKPFQLQLWMRTEGLANPGNPSAAKAYGRYQFYNSSGARIGAVRYLDIVTDDIDWTLSKAEFNMPAGAVRLSFEAFLENSVGSVWYDDIRLFEVLPDGPEEPPTNGDLLPNGGFETLGTASGWLNHVGPIHAATWRASGNPVFAVDDSVFHSGTRSVRIHGEPPNNSRGALVLETTAMEVGKPYLISGWVKTEDVSASAYVRFQYKRDGQSVNAEIANNISGTTDWTYFSRVMVLPDNIENPDAPLTKLEAFLENSTGTVWFDDFSIREHIPLVDFGVSPAIVEITSGGTTLLEASFIPVDASNRNLVWSSSHPDAVAVDQEGRVRGISSGYSIVSAASRETNKIREVAVSVDPAASLTVQPYEGDVIENGELRGIIAASDSANAPIEARLAIGPKNGTVIIQPDGSFIYYPKRAYAGPDEFTVMVSNGEGGPRFAKAAITVVPLQKPPVLDLHWYSTAKGTALSGKLGEVRSPSTETVTWTKSGSPLHGELFIQADGTFQYTPSPGFAGYDSFGVTATAEGGQQTEGRVYVFVVPDESDLGEALEASGGRGVHPRVLATADDFSAIRSLIGSDPYMTEWFERLRQDTEAMLDTSPYPYAANGGSNGSIRDLLIHTALMYQLTGEDKYADRAAAELLSAAEFADWGGRYNNMLSLTYLAYSAALAYDWIYDAMTAEQRSIVEEAISRHVFSHALDWYNGGFRHNGEFNNINFVDNGSFGITALALLGEESQAGDEAAQVLQGVYRKLQQALRYQEEDGAWPEGPSYWQYGTQPLFLMMAAMETALGTDYGLSGLSGMEQAGAYPLHLRGPGGPFNFNDGDIIDVYPQLLWLADRYDTPEYGWHAGQVYEETGLYSPFYLLLYQPGMFDVAPTELDRTFSGIEAMSMRSGWEDRNSVYAAMRGFDETMLSHNDLDAGTFVFDALGERWALDLGNENYNLPGFWQYEQGTRWTYYRKGAQGHNTIIINPQENPVHMQDYDAAAKLIEWQSKPLGAFGILDMTDRYPNDAVSYRRGLMLTGEREQLVIQDELRLKTPSEIYWFMHTKASISIIEGGRAAILSQKDKKLYVKMLEAPEGAAFMEMAAEPLPGTPNPDGQTMNHGVRKLAVHMNDVEQANLSIWMVPLLEEASLPLQEEAPGYTPLAEWVIPEGELPVKQPLPTVQSIYVNGAEIAGFDPARTYYEVVIPFEQTTAPRVEADSESEALIVQAEGVPGKSYIYAVDPANLDVRNRYTVSFVRGPILVSPPEVNRWLVQSVSASAVPQANLGYTPDKTLDGDLNTRWTSEGRQWIQYDLGETREVGAVSIAFFSGDTRTAYFTISSSTDGEHWHTVYDLGESSGLTSDPEVFHFDAVQARYIRINGSGNSTSRWNNITEVGIFRPSPVSVSILAPLVWKSGRQGQLSAQYNLYDGGQSAAATVTFNSSDSKILFIDAAGKAHARKPGKVQVTVHDLEYGLSGQLEIEVTAGNSPIS